MSRQPPISFKTVPNRNKTQKWQTARQYNYDGDDWGGYDAYDEYSSQSEGPPPPPAVPPLSTGPRVPRQDSFDRGDERRQFSGPAVLSGRGNRESPTRSNVSSNSSERQSADIQRPRVVGRPRDFTNPEDVPAPLSARSPVAARGIPTTAGNFPPRKSSSRTDLQDASAGTAPVLDISTTAINKSPVEKELPTIPFIRPSDIYKRMEEEREKERAASNDGSSRASMDSLQREPHLSYLDTSHRPLSAVVESPDTAKASPEESLPKTAVGSSALPEISRLSSFGADFLGSNTASTIEPGQIAENRAVADEAATQSTEQSTGLSHQPSSGYRSMVHQAFDRKAIPSEGPASRMHDDSTSASDFSRSNTTSTSTGSPIISRMSSSAHPETKQRERNINVSTIAEEGLLPGADDTSRHLPKLQTQTDMQRSVDVAASADALTSIGIQPGYRRSLEPPALDNSPARTVDVEDSGVRRFSGPLTAQTVSLGEAGAEPPVADEVREHPTTGRARAGTDYSVREADLAQAVNESSDEPTFSPAVAADEKLSQSVFLANHPSSTSEGRAANPDARSRDPSPTKGRVREIADKYHGIHNASQPGSPASTKSSWSNFRGSDEHLPLKRKGTEPENSGQERGDLSTGAGAIVGQGLGVNLARPAADRQQSFRPQLPGQWVSYTGTPEPIGSVPSESEATRDITPRAIRVGDPDDIDLTPTSKPVPLRFADGRKASPSPTPENPFSQAKTAGEVLGASILTTAGAGHLTRDFASTEPAPEVKQPESRRAIGDLDNSLLRPAPLRRGVTDNSDTTNITSIDGSAPPTPPAKDTPGEERDRITALPEFGQPPAANSGVNSNPSAFLPASTYDKQQQEKENLQRTQDALDAPTNAALLSAGQDPFPSAARRSPVTAKRFSWEKPDEAETVVAPVIHPAAPPAQPPPVLKEPVPDHSPEIKPEMPYERPRSRQLHLMNADSSDEDNRSVASSPHEKHSDHPAELAAVAVPVTLGSAYLSNKLPESRNTDNAHLGVTSNARDLKELAAPSPISDSTSMRLPSYYLADPETALAAEEAKSHDSSTGLGVQLDTKPALDDSNIDHVPETSPTSPTKKIPPFREILAIKSTSDRIQAYDNTRETFAQMNTGLSDWLSHMLVNHPEHATLAASGELAPAPITAGHRKNSHSIALKLGKGFGNDPQRGPSLDASDTAHRTPMRDFSGGVDMDKVQQKGKDLMKSASLLGGKAQVGAKGLWQKGRNRFGNKRDSGSGPSGGKFDSTTVRAQPQIPPVPQTASFAEVMSQILEPPADKSEAAREESPEKDLPELPIDPSPEREEDSKSKEVEENEDDAAPATAAISRATTAPIAATSSAPADNNTMQRNTSSRSLALGASVSRAISRLRDRSRSASRSRSRPRSWIATGGGAAPFSRVRQSRTSQDPNDWEAILLGQGRRVESWEVPSTYEALLPPRTPSRSGQKNAQQRLGVLPSPGTDTLATNISDSPERYRGSIDRSVLEQDIPPLSPELTRNVLALRAQESSSGTGAEQPGQLLSNSHDRVARDDDELYNITPTQTFLSQKASTAKPVSVEVNAVQQTSRANASSEISRSSSVAEDLNNRTAISPPLDPEAGGGATITGKPRSRHSSVSSLEEPVAEDAVDQAAELRADEEPTVSNPVDVPPRGRPLSSDRAPVTSVAALHNNSGPGSQPASDVENEPTQPPVSTEMILGASAGALVARSLEQPKPSLDIGAQQPEKRELGDLNTEPATLKGPELVPLAADNVQEANMVSVPLSAKPDIVSSTGEETRVNQQAQVQPQPQTIPDRRSKRFSGLFRSSQGNTSFGSNDAVKGQKSDDQPLDSTVTSNQGRRRSGFWESAIRRSESRTPGGHKRNSIAHTPADNSENTAATVPPVPIDKDRGQKLRKQRTSQDSTAKIAERESGKEKRSSSLGMFFGRSKTAKVSEKSEKPARPKKLSKRESVRNRSRSKSGASDHPGLEYDTFEAIRSEMTLDSRYHIPLESRRLSQYGGRYPAHNNVATLPTGNHAPNVDENEFVEERQPRIPNLLPLGSPEQPISQNDRPRQELLRAIMPDSTGTQHIEQGSVPSQNSSTNSSSQQRLQQHPGPPRRKPTARHSYVVTSVEQDPSLPTRSPSTGSVGPVLSPQVSGRSEWERSQWNSRDSMTAISPIASTVGSSFPEGRRLRVGSIDRQILGPVVQPCRTSQRETTNKGSDSPANIVPESDNVSLQNRSPDALGQTPAARSENEQSISHSTVPGQSNNLERTSRVRSVWPISKERTVERFVTGQSDSGNLAFDYGHVPPGDKSLQDSLHQHDTPRSNSFEYHARSTDVTTPDPGEAAPQVPRRSPHRLQGRRGSGEQAKATKQTGDDFQMRGSSYPGQEWTPFSGGAEVYD